MNSPISKGYLILNVDIKERKKMCHQCKRGKVLKTERMEKIKNEKEGSNTPIHPCTLMVFKHFLFNNKNKK